jgi:hypothetical protein
MRCRICNNPNLKRIVEGLRKDNFTYREIQEYLLTKFNFKVSLGTISNHFFHIQESKLPILKENEFILTKETIKKISNTFMEIFKKYIKNPDIVESFYEYLNNYKEPEPEIETNISAYEDFKKLILNSPLEDNLKNKILEEFSNNYLKIIAEQQIN